MLRGRGKKEKTEAGKQEEKGRGRWREVEREEAEKRGEVGSCRQEQSGWQTHRALTIPLSVPLRPSNVICPSSKKVSECHVSFQSSGMFLTAAATSAAALSGQSEVRPRHWRAEAWERQEARPGICEPPPVRSRPAGLWRWAG